MEDSDLIREQIEQTRGSLTDKLETLEGRVAATVEEASEAVTNVTGAVEDTLATVSDSVQETVTNVKDSVGEAITDVKSLFDLPQLADRHPWIVVGGALAAGFVLGEVLSAGDRMRSAPQSHAVASGHGNGQPENANGSTKGGSLLERFEPEMSKLTGLALGVLMGTFREMIAKAAGASLGEPVGEIIDSVTEKIGGTPIPHEDRQPGNDEPQEHAAEMPSRHRAEAMEVAGEPVHMTA